MTDTTDRRALPVADPVPPIASADADSFRSQLKPGADVVDPEHWTGSVPVAHGIAPRVRIGLSRWCNLLWLLPIGFVLLIVAVATAKGLRGTDGVRGFISDDPGTVEPSAGSPVGTPWWVGVSHFLNLCSSPACSAT